MSILLLNTAYFPPIQYFSKIKEHEQFCIEQYENYGKQSYRNRCRIQFANGIMPLVVPVKKKDGQKFLTKEAKSIIPVNGKNYILKVLNPPTKIRLFTIIIQKIYPFFLNPGKNTCWI